MLLSFGFQSTRGQQISFWNLDIGGLVDCTIKLLLAHASENKSAIKQGNHFNINISDPRLQKKLDTARNRIERDTNHVMQTTTIMAFEM